MFFFEYYSSLRARICLFILFVFMNAAYFLLYMDLYALCIRFLCMSGLLRKFPCEADC